MVFLICVLFFQLLLYTSLFTHNLRFFPLWWFTGNEELKLASLLALASWGARCPDTTQADVVSFIGSGLKEKETLRRGHLRCLRFMCKNTDAVVRVRKLIKFIFLDSCL